MNHQIDAAKYPERFELEIDRDALRRYYRWFYFRGWMLLLSPFCFIFGMSGATFSTVETGEHSDAALTGFIILYSAWAVLACMLLSAVCYLVMSHRWCAHYARTLSVAVDGKFLHIRESRFKNTDQKIHFRSIIDYTLVDTWLMRRTGVRSIVMRTAAGGPESAIGICGIANAEEVRDILAEIDSNRELREDTPS